MNKSYFHKKIIENNTNEPSLGVFFGTYIAICIGSIAILLAIVGVCILSHVIYSYYKKTR